MYDVGSVLGDKIKIRMILAVYREGSMLKTALYSIAGRNALNASKLDDLCDAGLVHLSIDRFKNNQTTITLTDRGRMVAERLAAIDDILIGIPPADDAAHRCGNVGSGPPAEVDAPRGE